MKKTQIEEIEIPTVSYVFKNGDIVESVYDKKEKAVRFAHLHGGEVELKNRIQNEREAMLVPYTVKNLEIEGHPMTLPASTEEYGTKDTLMRDISRFFSGFAAFSIAHARLAAAYVLTTWIYRDFDDVPYLRLSGSKADDRARLLSLFASVCYMPMCVSGKTSQRKILGALDRFRGTLLVNDFPKKPKADLLAVLNAGNGADVPVLQCEAGGRSIRHFEIYGPKIFASHDPLSDAALESRCLTFEAKDVVADPDLDEDIEKEAEILRNKLLLYRFRTHGTHEAAVIPYTDYSNRIAQYFSILIGVVGGGFRNQFLSIAKEHDLTRGK
jgi:hypothetical protein